jgi:hypothetical protein
LADVLLDLFNQIIGDRGLPPKEWRSTTMTARLFPILDRSQSHD